MHESNQQNQPTAAYHPQASTDAVQTIISSTSPQGGKLSGIDQVPGYELLREIGRGGMGVVYLARQQSLNRLVALKMVLAGSHASEQDIQRFRVEAEAVAQLQHPHIVQVFETGEHQGKPWFSMEYVAGGTLEKRIQGRPLPHKEAARVVVMLANAVAHAHARGVLHRDLKPGNILIQEVDAHTTSIETTQRTNRHSSQSHRLNLDPMNEEGSTTSSGHGVTLKVTDFGLAKQIQEGAARVASHTQAGTVLGSPSYMAPEQAAGDTAAIGPAVDVYAMGSILYELLTGRPPFRAASAWDTMMQVLHDEPVPPTRLQPKLPRDLETICLKCLAKDPKKRYTAAGELESDLERFLHDEPILARPNPWWERAWKAAKRRPTLAALLVTSGLAIGLIIALISVGNARLQRERDSANQARAKAVLAQEKSQKRLQMAIEAVEKLLTRTATENWARRPELQEERKRLLEETVTFYQAFLEQESDDPLLRRETAKAYFRMAGVYLLMGEHRQAEDTLKKAKSLQEALCDEFPDIPEYKHELIKTVNFLGNAEVMQGQFSSSLTAYEKAARQAETLSEAFPDNDEFKITLVRTYLSLGYFYNVSQPAKAAEYQLKALNVGKKLYEKDSQSYVNQLTYVGPLLQHAETCLNNNRAAEAGTYLSQAGPILDLLAKAQPPDAHSRDLLDSNRSKHAILNGYYLVRTNRQQEGEAELRRGVGIIDDLLVQRPKMFPYRIMQVNALQTLGEVQDRQAKRGDAKKNFERAFKLNDQMARDMPQMPWLKSQGLAQRSLLLVMRAREGELQGLMESIQDLQKSPLMLTNDGLVMKYNIACTLAQAAHHEQGQAKEQHAQAAVKMLENLYQAKYFKSTEAKHLLVDTDLDPLRQREDFKTFMKHFEQPISDSK